MSGKLTSLPFLRMSYIIIKVVVLPIPALQWKWNQAFSGALLTDLRAEAFDISVVFRKLIGSEVELDESWIILISVRALVGNEIVVNKIIVVNKKIKKILIFFSLVYTS